MKYIVKLITVYTVLCFSFSLNVLSQANTKSAPRDERRTRRELPQTAPKIVPNTTAAMQTPEFWISDS